MSDMIAVCNRYLKQAITYETFQMQHLQLGV